MDSALGPEKQEISDVPKSNLSIKKPKQAIFGDSNLVLFEVCSDSPSLVIGQCVPVFLEQRIDTRNTSVP